MRQSVWAAVPAERHVRTALTAVNVSLPVRAGRPVLGAWQGIYLWEHRTHPHSRRVALHFIGE